MKILNLCTAHALHDIYGVENDAGYSIVRKYHSGEMGDVKILGKLIKSGNCRGIIIMDHVGSTSCRKISCSYPMSWVITVADNDDHVLRIQSFLADCGLMSRTE